ncbi:MAG: 2-hydroxyacyl-CoA dehydratase [Planctomycetes bacterium]|nr:2-hydroxyacyl-CoA dehydratase [Planctomycetota bacterium]
MLIAEIFDRCRALVDDTDLSTVAAWKAAHPGAKAIGCFPVYVPTELVHAAGMLPVGLVGGGGHIEMDHADSLVQSFVCSISRSTLELGMTGRFRNLDGLLFPSICDVARNLSGMCSRNFPALWVDYIHLPQNRASAGVVDYYRSELARVQVGLDVLAGRTTTFDALAASIQAFNQQRAVLRDLHAFRRSFPWLLSTEELHLLTNAGSVLDVAEHTNLLQETLNLLSMRKGKPKDRIRVLLEGAFCEQPPLELMKAIEEAGCWIVEDDLLLGRRWLATDVTLNGDPLRALAESYVRQDTVSSVRHERPRRRADSLVERAREARVDGVLLCSAKFCEPALFDQVLLRNALEQAGIPHLALEFEEKMGVFETPRTQVETFVESILFA